MSYKGVIIANVLPRKKDKYESFEVYYGAIKNKIKYTVGAEPGEDIKKAIENIYNIDSKQYSESVAKLRIEYRTFKKLAGHINLVLPPSTTPALDLITMVDIYKSKTIILSNLIRTKFNADESCAAMEEELKSLTLEAIESIRQEVRKIILNKMGYKYYYTVRIRRYVDMITTHDAIKEDITKMISEIIRARKATTERRIDASISGMFVDDRTKNIRDHKATNYRRI